MRYDCIIIGSGPAGLSAAINLKTYNQNSNLGMYENIRYKTEVVWYYGEVSGSSK